MDSTAPNKAAQVQHPRVTMVEVWRASTEHLQWFLTQLITVEELQCHCCAAVSQPGGEQLSVSTAPPRLQDVDPSCGSMGSINMSPLSQSLTSDDLAQSLLNQLDTLSFSCMMYFRLNLNYFNLKLRKPLTTCSNEVLNLLLLKKWKCHLSHLSNSR